MTLSEQLLAEMETEVVTTRKMLERVPDDDVDWKPHVKSMTIGRLTGHTAEVLGWAATVMDNDEWNFVRSEYVPVTLEKGGREKMLKQFEENVAKARKSLAGKTDADFDKTWTMKLDGKAMLDGKKRDLIRRMAMNHLVHHRAQLGVYLRLKDVPIPGTYGPSADDMPRR
jgi:uncharacterized damage-inducible protein DinB